MNSESTLEAPAEALVMDAPARVEKGAPADIQSRRALRVFYAAGDGDVMGTFSHWRDRKDDPAQLSMTYSGQFFDAIERLGYEGIVLSQDAKTGVTREGRFTVRQRRLFRFRYGPGPLYHLEQTIAALRVVLLAVRYRADVVLAASGACHWFPLVLLRLLGIRVVPTFHCVLWPKYKRPGLMGRMVNWLDGKCFSLAAPVAMSASSDINEQLVELLGEKKAGRMRVFGFLPSYRRADFPPAKRAVRGNGLPFRALYAGRLVGEKGIFDLVAAAELLSEQGRRDVEFDVCGTGPGQDEMQARARTAGITMRFHGHCARPQMREMFERCHAVIVPTTTGFVEGFNQVVAEGILSGRPVIASTVCPATKYVGDAVMTVAPDDVAGYAGALVKLADDGAFYERCVAACEEVREQFFDEARGWGGAIEKALGKVN